MESLRELCSKLEPPWDERAMDSMGRCLEPIFAVVTSVSETVIECQKIPFQFFEGLQPDQALEKTKIFTSQPIDIKPTQMIGFKDFVQVNNDYHETATSILWFISNHERHAPLHFTHLFSGSFCGWHQAAVSLEQSEILKIGSSSHIDCDEDVIAVWSKGKRADVFYKEVSIHTSKSRITGVLSTVGKHHWLNLNRSDINAIYTASPPCQPWSRGGKERGLEDSNGLAFIDAIVAVHHGRPLIFLIECTEKTWRHSHFHILQTFLACIGYKRVWQDEVETRELTHMYRKRWLAIWVRKDQDAEMFNGSFKLFDPAKLPWSHPLFRFEVPQRVAEQLKLSPSLQKIYGDPKLLPKGNDRSGNEAMTLSIRCLDPSASVPTLCASYTKQHDLPQSHLESKGLFTFLIPACGEWFFMDPFVLTALMGMTVDSTLAMACKVPICFQQLGNSIHTVHAALAISLGLAALKMHNQSVKSSVLFVWERHINSINTVIVCGRDFMWIIPDQLYQQDFEFLQAIFDGKGIIISSGFGRPVQLGNMKVGEFLRQAGFDLFRNSAFTVECDHHIDHHTMLLDLIDRGIRILRDQNPIVSLAISASAVEMKSPITILDSPSSTQIITEFFKEHDQHSPIQPTQLFDAAPSTRVKVAIFHAINGSCESEWFDAHNMLETIAETYPGLHVTKCRSYCSFMPDTECFLVHNSPFYQSCILFVDGTHEHARAIMTARHWTPEIHFQDIMHVSHMYVNASPVNLTTQLSFTNGDVITVFQADPRQTIAERMGAKLGSDEAHWMCTRFQTHADHAIFLPPISIKYDCEEVAFQALSPYADQISGARLRETPVFLMLLIHDHWSAIEISFQNSLVHTKLVSFRNNDRLIVTNAIARIFGLQPSDLAVENIYMTYPKDMCGWAIIFRWSQHHATQITSAELSDIGFPSSVHGTFNFHMLQFAKKVRHSFLSDSNAWSRNPDFGGAEGDEKLDEPMAAPANDPWVTSTRDPWSKARAKWEDLKLLPDHPFIDSAGKRLVFRPKQQLLGSQGGISFVNKNGIADIIANPPSETTAIIIPYADRSSALQHVVPSHVQGPYEITAQDPLSKEVYKRMVLTIKVTSKHDFKLPQSSYQGVLESVSELVIEADSRISNKDYMSGFLNQGLENFKQKIAEQFPTVKQISVYGFRKVNLDKEQFFYQVICRVPSSSREAYLARSGIGELTCRDFISKDADPPADISVVPRFFECSRSGKQTLLKASADCKGFAGIIATRRGLAARAWSSQIGCLRTALLPNDPRITDDNRDVAPRYVYNSYGWPSSISPQEVIRATLHYTTLGAVPTRCSRSNGVVCWTLGFAQKPEVDKFSAAFNQVPVEIVLSPATAEVPSTKKGKPKRVQNNQAAPTTKQPKEEIAASSKDDSRLTTLEAKVAHIEKKQESMESKMDSGFEGIQSQLRQLLNLAKPRHAEKGTGETPPPKSHKTA
eukprot:Skav201705  [mRNA]  locus=scaffold2750:50465:54844:+ [translate_table: standard]